MCIELEKMFRVLEHELDAYAKAIKTYYLEYL
jgi:hypothetical protein